MALPKPIILFSKDNCPEYEILFPCIAEWVDHSPRKPLQTVDASVVQVQIIDIKFEIEFDEEAKVYWCMNILSLSDGLHFVKTNLSRELNYMVDEKHLEIYDIIQVNKSTWNKNSLTSLTLELVKVYMNLSISLMISFQNEILKVSMNPQCMIGNPTELVDTKMKYAFPNYSSTVEGIVKL